MLVQSILFLSLMSIITDSTTEMKLIKYGVYNPPNLVNPVVHIGTCDQCICHAFSSSNSINYTGLNCYENNSTCLLFQNNISQSFIQINIDSTLIYKPVQSIDQSNDQLREFQMSFFSLLATSMSTAMTPQCK